MGGVNLAHINWVYSIWLLKSILLFSFSYGYHVLLIGDSIDRYTVVDWCYIDRPKPVSKLICPGCIYWFEETGSKWDSSICIKGNDSIANVHHFGSRDQGPYFSKPEVAERDFAPNIIRNSINRYFDRIGVPDLILYQAVLWDVAYMKTIYEPVVQNASVHGNVAVKYTAAWNESISVYKTNMLHRIKDVQDAITANLVGRHLLNHVNFGLRTGVYNDHIGNLANDFNDVVRELTQANNLTLFDLDKEVWSTYNWDRSKEAFTMRDIVHPLPYFTSLAGSKLLGHRYSSNLIFRGPTDVLSPRPRICLSPHSLHHYHCPLSVIRNEPITEVKLIAPFPAKTIHKQHLRSRRKLSIGNESSSDHEQIVSQRKPSFRSLSLADTPVYYLHHDPATLVPERVGPVNDHLRMVLRLSQGEILYMSSEDVDKLPMSHLRFPPISSEDSANSVVNTTTGQLYIYFPNKEIFRQYTNSIQGLSMFGFTTIPPRNTSTNQDWTCPNITQNVSQTWLTELFTIGATIPNIYYHGALIRFVSQREVYVVLDGVKRMIPNASVFMKYGSDWSEVQVIGDIDDFDRIPTGPSL